MGQANDNLGALLKYLSDHAENTKRRADSWIATVRERRSEFAGAAWWAANFLDPQSCADLFHFMGIAQRIAAVVPEEATREPFVWQDVGDKTYANIEAYGVQEAISRAGTLGRAMGGAAILIVTKDANTNHALPLDPKTAGEVLFLKVADRRELGIASFYDQPEEILLPRYKAPRTYTYKQDEWHESRFVFFGGAITAEPERKANQHWDFSIYQGSEETLTSFETAWTNALYMLDRTQQGVFLLKDWAAKMASDNAHEAVAMMRHVDRIRSQFRSIALDKDGEDFKNVSAAFTGVSDIMDRASYKLAAEFGIPVTLLMGQAPAGLNATGDADTKNFYGKVAAYQRKEVYRNALKIAALIALGVGEPPPALEFAPLWIETRTERAVRHKTLADTDGVYIQNGVIDPGQVAQQRLVDGDWENPPRAEAYVPVKLDEPQEGALPGEQKALPPGAPSPTPAGVPAEGTEQETKVDPALVLNGAQISSVVEIAEKVKQGLLDHASAVAIIAIGFNINEAQALRMVGPVPLGLPNGSTPTPQAPAPGTPPASPPPPAQGAPPAAP